MANKKFQGVKEKYRDAGVKDDDIDYVIISIKENVPRQLIYDGLTTGYRHVNGRLANMMLDDFYQVHGGENKSANRFALFIGVFLLLVAAFCILSIIRVYPDPRYPLGFPKAYGSYGGVGLIGGIYLIYGALRKKR